jgi:hypothetical protein
MECDGEEGIPGSGRKRTSVDQEEEIMVVIQTSPLARSENITLFCHSRWLPLRAFLSQHGRKQAGDRTIKFMAINDLFIYYLKLYLEVCYLIEMPHTHTHNNSSYGDTFRRNSNYSVHVVHQL